MQTSLSSRNLHHLAFPAHYLAVDPRIFLRESGFNPARPPVTIRHQRYMATAQVELSRNSTLDISSELSPNSVGVHISCEATNVCFVESKLEDARIFVKENLRTLERKERLAIFSAKIKELRISRKMKQAPLAALCGVSVAQVSRWERSLDVPSAAVLLKLSEFAPEQERQWWRDQAAEQVGFNLDASNPSGSSTILPKLRTVPLLREARGMGVLGTLLASQVERDLHFPAEWFPEGGTIRAVRINSDATSEMIAMIDISRKDADRLVGHLVAVQTSTGVEIRWLSLEDGVYMLLPFQPAQPLKRLRSHGENSIVGLVRWIGDSAEPAERPSLSN